MSKPIAQDVHTILWRKGGEVVEGFPLEELSEHLQEDGSLVWADLCDPTPEVLGRLADELALDERAVADSVSLAVRPKATRHATHTFVTAYATRLGGAADDSGRTSRESRLEASRVSAFVLPNGMVTVRRDGVLDMGAVVDRWMERADLLEYGPGALLHGLLDVIVDGHFDTVSALDDAMEDLEDELFDERVDAHGLQQRTYRLRKELVELRRLVLPMREVVNTVMRHRADTKEHNGHLNELDGWYTDLYDHVLRASEWTESLRDMVTTVFETNLALQDARLNTVMKKLTGWAAIVAVPTAVTGWFGMNVAYPGIGHASGFWASTIVILGLGVGLYAVFKRLSWI